MFPFFCRVLIRGLFQKEFFTNTWSVLYKHLERSLQTLGVFFTNTWSVLYKHLERSISILRKTKLEHSISGCLLLYGVL